jgi:hypothetical protein
LTPHRYVSASEKAKPELLKAGWNVVQQESIFYSREIQKTN